MTEFLSKSNFNFEAIFQMNDISKPTQRHLNKVYAALGSGVVFSLICGVLASKGLIPIWVILPLACAAIIIDIILIFFSHGSKFANNYLKPGSFYTYALCFGGLIGNMFHEADYAERKLLGALVTTSFVYTLSVFGSFSILALITVRRTQIFFGAIIASFVLSFISIFIFSAVLESLIGLALAILYVIIDTQIIIHKTENGIFDVFTDAKELFIDMFKIFIEIMNLLSKKEKKN